MSYSRAMRVFLAFSLIVGALFNSPFAGQVKFTKIDVPGAAGVTTPSGINPQSNIVGTYFTFSNQTVITRGFLLSGGNALAFIPAICLSKRCSACASPLGARFALTALSTRMPSGH
jgi:hypothetical protein